MATMRVDNVPGWLRPSFELWAKGAEHATAAFLFHRRGQLTITCDGPGQALTQAIYCIWHEDLMYLFLTLHRLNHPQIWMNHPAWYMKPVHLLLARLDITELCLGSTGHHGQAALAALTDRMRETTASTTLAVDGPSGPFHQLRKGCLYLARDTGVPIVPLGFRCSDEFRLPFNWDRKRTPRAGAVVEMHFHRPIWVSSNTSLDLYGEQLVVALNTPAPRPKSSVQP